MNRVRALVAMIFVGSLAGCDSGPAKQSEQPNAHTPHANPQSQVAYVPKNDWPKTEEQVAQLLARRQGRGGPLSDEEVAKLEFAADQGVLSAYFDLYWHHSTEGDPSQEKKWFDEGVKRGEPNLLVLVAERQKAAAEKVGVGPARAKLLREAKKNFRAALSRRSQLTVASAKTVQEEISETDSLLARSS